MADIIAGGFDNAADAEAAVRRLQDADVPLEYICTFRVNPPGEHNALAAGGDHDASAGAKHAHSGAVKGAAIGAAVGGAAGAVVGGPIGAAAGIGVGAYTGSLVGSLKEIDSEVQPDHADVRPAENLVAVNVEAASFEPEAVISIFRALGARQIERADGRWEDGVWADFDASTPPLLVGGRDLSPEAPRPGA